MITALAFWVLAAAAAPGGERADPPADPRAVAAFERTKRTRATYALYAWSWVKGSGFESGPRWSAEFHRGNLHRVETPEVRVIADCAAGTGTMFEVASGRTESGSAAAGAACGINSNFPIRALEWLGRRDTRFGPLDMLRVVDSADERIYGVDRSGVLVASEVFPLVEGSGACLQLEPLAVERQLPAKDMFSIASLAKSFAAARFRSPPKTYAGDLWLGARRCV